MKQNISLQGAQRVHGNYLIKQITRIYALLLFCLLCMFIFVTGGRAATIYVSSYGDGTCSLTNVKSAYDTASPGDTIVFPTNSSATWSNTLQIRKPITILGAGTTLTAGGSMTTGFFDISGFTPSSIVRISGFTINMVDCATEKKAIYVHGMIGGVSVGNIRIDNNTFHHGYVQIEYEHGKGLIDNNHFINARKAIAFSAGGRANADESWESLAAGTADALFIEDNYFVTDTNYTLTYGQEQIGTFNGGKLVVRYNEFDADDVVAYTATYTPFMAHGNADGGCNMPGVGYWQYDADTDECIRRGQSVVEFYNNVAHGKRIDFLFQTRGSANLIYNNAITGTVKYAPGILFWEEEYGNNFLTKRTAWPAEDTIHNTFIWNNTYNGSARFNVASHIIIQAVTSGAISESNEYIRLNRDVFLHAPCGASDAVDAYGNACTHGKASFTGSNGASGSYPTNGSIYPTQGTMIFTKTGDNAYYGYTPYTYPHPLRSSTATYTENTQEPLPTTSVPPTIAVSPTIKDFGTLPINTSSSAQKFTVTTTGGNLNVDAISMTGTDANQFVIQNDSCTGKIIAPGTVGCTFYAKFSPSSVGAKAANVAIVDNDSNTSKLIAVNGTGTSQIPAISFSPTSLSFSNVLSGTLSSPQTINVSNNSVNFVTISSVSLSGTYANQFSIPAATDYCTGETVAASGKCSFQVIFAPTSGGEKTANVNLTALYYSNPATLPLYGSAVVYPAPKIKISRKK